MDGGFYTGADQVGVALAGGLWINEGFQDGMRTCSKPATHVGLEPYTCSGVSEQCQLLHGQAAVCRAMSQTHLYACFNPPARSRLIEMETCVGRIRRSIDSAITDQAVEKKPPRIIGGHQSL